MSPWTAAVCFVKMATGISGNLVYVSLVWAQIKSLPASFHPHCEDLSGTDPRTVTPAWLRGECEFVLTQYEEHVCLDSANVEFCTWTPEELGQTWPSPSWTVSNPRLECLQVQTLWFEMEIEHKFIHLVMQHLTRIWRATGTILKCSCPLCPHLLPSYFLSWHS